MAKVTAEEVKAYSAETGYGMVASKRILEQQKITDEAEDLLDELKYAWHPTLSSSKIVKRALIFLLKRYTNDS